MKATAVNRFIPALALTVLSTVFYTSANQALAQSEPSAEQLRACGQIADSASRYACYDRLTANQRPASGTAAPAAAAPSSGATRSTIPARLPASAATPPASAVSSSTAGSAANNSATPAATATTPAAASSALNSSDSKIGFISNETTKDTTEWTDTIAELKELEPGQWLITLAGGQVWHQVGNRRFALREGMSVRFHRGLFGSSWRIDTPDLKGFIQVERVK
jgi:hypothetical protein